MWTHSVKSFCDEMTTIIQKDQGISFVSEYEVINVEINKSKSDVLVDSKLLRRDVSFIRISNKNYPPYLKSSQPYNSGYLPPVINNYHISRMFLQSITINISYSTCWNEYINGNRLKRSEVKVNKVADVSIFTSTLIDKLPVLSSKYTLWESLSIETTNLKNIPLHVIKLKNIIKELTSVLEDKDIAIDIVCWDGHRIK